MAPTRFLALVAALAAAGMTGPLARPLAGQVPEPAPQQDEQPTFSVAVDLVRTDVIPRDASGQFVSDLTIDDLTVLEDGVAQEIASLVLVHGGRTFNLLTPPPPPSMEGIVLPAARPTNDTAGRVFILFIDDLHLQALDSHHVRALLKQIDETLIHEGDVFAAVSTGSSSIELEMTYDQRRLAGAISRVKGEGLTALDIMSGAETSGGPAQVRDRAWTAFATAYDLINQLADVTDRRKSFLYISNGYDFDPYHEGRLGQDSIMSGRWADPRNDPVRGDVFFQLAREKNIFADADLFTAVADLANAANRANVTFYTIDPRGLTGGMDAGNNSTDPMEQQTYIAKSQSTLRLLAEVTGGLAIVNQNDFEAALKRIDAETSDYYVIGYYSSNPDPTDKTRQLEVRVDRPGVSVWSRGYYSLKPGARRQAESQP